MQTIVLLLSTFLMSVVAACFIWAIKSTKISTESGSASFEEFTPKAYRARAIIFGVVIIVGIVATYKTLVPWPHDTRPQVVSQSIDVKSNQWAWDLPKSKIKVGDEVEFRVTSADVNHVFGLYSPAGQIVAQVQAMPGFENILRYRFSTPGKYKILCMEYCGLGHHRMDAELDVE